MTDSTDCSTKKCPFSCPIFKKCCCFLGLIGFITAIYLWWAAPAKPFEFVAHRERMAIFVLLLSHIICGLGKKGCCCPPKCDDKTACETK